MRQTAAKKSEVQGGKKRGTGDRREKLEHGRRMRGGREEMRQAAAKKSEVQGGKRKGVRETGAKIIAWIKNERRKGGNAPNSR